MDDPINTLITNFIDHFLELNAAKSKRKLAAGLFRIHKVKLKESGDLSFPIQAHIWRNCLESAPYHDMKLLEKLRRTDLMEECKQQLLAAIATSSQYSVRTLSFSIERCAVFLNRSLCMEIWLKKLLNENQTGHHGSVNKPRERRKIQLNEIVNKSAENLTLYRAILIKEVLSRLLAYSSEWREVVVEGVSSVSDNAALQLSVVSVVEDFSQHKNAVLIKCGLVCDPKTGKQAQLCTTDYQNMRLTDMRLLAMHKYGIRIKSDDFCALLKRLGPAAVIVDLLEVKHSSPVRLIRNGQGSSTKGASFILYNCARLETLLRKFEQRVASSLYAQPPPIDEIDFSLLCEEEEWQLCYAYVMQFPILIERCLEQIEKGVCATHLIVRFLSDFVAVFSVYYRRIRILTQETRVHLMPYVYARIYLLKAIRLVLNRTLSLLNIEPVSFM